MCVGGGGGGEEASKFISIFFIHIFIFYYLFKYDSYVSMFNVYNNILHGCHIENSSTNTW